MRRAILVLLLVAAAFAGCLDQGQDLDPSDEPDAGPSDPDRNEDRQRSGNDTEDDDGSSSDGGSGNETGEDDAGETDPGWPSPDEAALRPGASILDGICTANYVFSSPDNSSLYVGTAAHCVSEVEPGQRVPLADGAAAGVLVYSSFRAMDRANESSQAARTFNDFALIRVDPGFRDEVHPALLRYGGPTGQVGGAGTGERVLTYGESQLRSGTSAQDPREGHVVADSEWNVDHYVYGPSVPGDSGSPLVTADGEALGVVVSLEFAPAPASNNAVKVQRAVEYMEAHGGPQVELETWSQFDDGILFP